MKLDINIASPGLRFALGVSGNYPLVVIGLNPSTATDIKFDLTLRKVSTIANHKGFDGFVMLNLCPIRSTAIAQLPHNLPDRLHQQNIETICQILALCSSESRRTPTIWAAWGVGIQERSYFGAAFKAIVKNLRDPENIWLHYDTLTKDGHPRHPSRARYGASFHPFKVGEYADKINSLYKN